MKDYYEILEVHPKASYDVIKKAYTVLAKKYHPDITSLDKAYAQSKMIELNEAYNILSNAEKRKQYDAQLEYAKYAAFRQKTEDDERKASENAAKAKQASIQKEKEVEIQRVKSRFVNSCNYYIDILNKRVINGDQQAKTGTNCSNIQNQFYNEIQQDYIFIEQEKAWDPYISEGYGNVLWWFGTAYISCGDYQNAQKSLNMASGFINPSSSNYTNFCQTKNEVYSKLHPEKTSGKQDIDDFNNKEYICPNCGNRIKSSMKFCNKCGTKLTWDGVVDENNIEDIRRENLQSHNSETIYRTDDPNKVHTCPCCNYHITTKNAVCPNCYKKLIWVAGNPPEKSNASGCFSGCIYFFVAIILFIIAMGVMR